MLDEAGLRLERRALDVFDVALAWPEAARGATLRARYADDPALIARVERLLAAQADVHLLHTALPHAEGGQRGPMVPAEVLPERVGAYRLAGLIGEGGMGTVHRAERVEGGFGQVVAIKLIRGGLFSSEAAARFATEREILARLRHPHVTRLFDGGVTADGRSYIVMELVDGLPITGHAAAAGLDLRARLGLFCDVCDAVGYAHQQGVVHADIKPGNLLVDPVHGVKLLDFGISALVAEECAQGNGFTAAYASPQQKQGARPVPADDVFALGCLLLALTEGLARGRDAELRAVAAKACAEAARYRYASCGALADDVMRLCRGFPVQARARRRRREAVFFWRRHRLGVSAAAAAVAALAVSLGVTAWLEMRAEAARAQADRRFVEVRALSAYLLDDVTDRLQAFPGTSSLRRDIATRSRVYLEGLSRVPDAAPDIGLEAALGYVKTGRILGLPDVQGMGDIAAAKQDLARAETGLRFALDKPALAGRAAIGLAEALSARAAIARSADNEPALSRRLYEEAARLSAPAAAEAADPAAAALAYAGALTGLAALDDDAGRFADMLPLLDRAAAAVAPLPPEPDRTGRAIIRATILNLRGDAVYFLGNPPASLLLYQQAASILQAARGPAPDMRLLERSAFTSWNVESVLVELGRKTEGLAVIDRGVADAELMRLFENSTRARHIADIVHTQRADALAALGRFDDAVAQARAELADVRATAAAWPGSFEAQRSVPVVLRPVGDVYLAAGLRREACSAFSEARRDWDRLVRTAGVTGYDSATEIALLDQDVAACRTRVAELVPRDGP